MVEIRRTVRLDVAVQVEVPSALSAKMKLRGFTPPGERMRDYLQQAAKIRRHRRPGRSSKHRLDDVTPIASDLIGGEAGRPQASMADRLLPPSKGQQQLSRQPAEWHVATNNRRLHEREDAVTPALCPTVLGSNRHFAQRPLPSTMIAPYMDPLLTQVLCITKYPRKKIK